MHLGMIRLGRMGANLVRRLTKDGHTGVVYDVNPAAAKKIAGKDVQRAASIDEGVPAPVINAALFERFTSRGDADHADRILSAMRKQLGEHDDKRAGR